MKIINFINIVIFVINVIVVLLYLWNRVFFLYVYNIDEGMILIMIDIMICWRGNFIVFVVKLIIEDGIIGIM